MDNILNLNTDFAKNMVSSILTKLIYKKTKCNIDVQINNLNVYADNSDTVIADIKAKAAIEEQNLNKFMNNPFLLWLAKVVLNVNIGWILRGTIASKLTEIIKQNLNCDIRINFDTLDTSKSNGNIKANISATIKMNADQFDNILQKI